MNDIINSICKSFQLIGISYTKKYINIFLENHSDPHSMLCISDLFDSYKIDTTAGEFDDKMELLNYPGVHISQLVDNEKSYFVVVEYIKENSITYYDEGRKIKESLFEYFKKWQGFVLFFTKKTDSAEPNYAGNRKKERLQKIKLSIYTLSAVILLTSILYSCWPLLLPTVFSGLLFLKFTGIAISILLLSYNYNSENSLVKGICNIGKKTNCSAILNSKAAKLFSFLSWAEVGLFYFTATFLTLLLTEILQLKSGYYLLAAINILALPYTLYSVYYQQKVAKSWCTMCLSVQVLLWLEFAVGSSLWPSFNLQNFFLPAIIFFISGMFILATWYLIKALLEANRNLKIAKKDLSKFKQNLPLFRYALSNQPNLSYPKQADAFRFGSQNPKVHFTIFTSPVCAYCNKTHVNINKLLNAYPNDIAFTEIFAISNDDKDERKQVAAHMLQLQKQQGEEYARNALHEWHSDENRKMEKWMAKHPVSGNAMSENSEIIRAHTAISNSLSITHTPTICINGKLLPDLYRIEDLEKIIPAYLVEL